MKIPQWIFDECKRLGFIVDSMPPVVWDKSINPAWMIYKLILKDRKRRDHQGCMKKKLPRKLEGSTMQRAKEERRSIILAAIQGVVIPEYHFDKQHPIPDHVKQIIRDLKIEGAFSFTTSDRDIWRSLYNTHKEGVSE